MILLGFAILCAYGAALWWLLQRESPWTVAALACLCGISLALRLVYFSAAWPLGEDEPKFLACSVQALARGQIAGESCVHVPYLLTSLFEAPLVPLLGANRWSIRTYSMLTSVLATPALFAAARAMGLRGASSLLVGGLAAVLPWSLFYGRVIMGGELIFHQALLLAGLARLVWQRGRWPDVLVASLGLGLLLWDYWAGRAMVGVPLVAAVLATGWRRLGCLAVAAIALVGWLPHLATHPAYGSVGFSLPGAYSGTTPGALNPEFAAAPWQALVARTQLALRTFVAPVAEQGNLTMHTVAMHPPLLLALAALGLLTGVRRGLFLLAGFLAGIAPGVGSGTPAISTHRIMMSYAFVAIAAAAPIDWLPWARLRRLAAVALLGFAALWSVPFYFSAQFWPAPNELNENAELTAVAEAIADQAPTRLVFMSELGNFGFISSAPVDSELLRIDNWLPDTRAVTYAFTWQASRLRPQYERLFPGRVRPVGRYSFLVNLEAGDWSWLQRYGWRNEVRCGDTTRVAHVPFLYNSGLVLGDFGCPGPVTFVWRAHWHGPSTEMTLAFSGAATIEAPGVSLQHSGGEQYVPFVLAEDADVAISLTVPAGVAANAMLLETGPGGQRIPDWDRFTPAPASS